MNDERRFEMREDLLVEQVDDEVVVLDMERNVYFGLEPMARAIWEMLKQGSSVSEVVAALHARYGEQERIERDVATFVAQVLEQGLMREASAR